MQFDGYVTNVGEGPIHIEGNPQLSGEVLGSGQVGQWILDENDDPVFADPFYLTTDGTDPQIKYEVTDDHLHWHLMKIAEYSLWDHTKTSQVVVGEKVGFCLYDIGRVDGVPGPPSQIYDGGGNWCAASGYTGGGSTAESLAMGTSEGWRDVYGFTINLQWIDVTDVAPGNYYLAGRADPDDLIAETDELNNGYEFGVGFATVPGHVARDSVVYSLVPVDFDLVVDTYSATIDEDPADSRAVPDAVECPGETDPILCAQENVPYPKDVVPQLQLATLPQHGTLTQGAVPMTVGVPFTELTVTYTPDIGFVGCDSFTFSAADSASAFPLNPVVATTTVAVSDNCDPVMINPGDQSEVVSEAVGVPVVVTDVDGDEVTLMVDGLPPGAEVDGLSLTGSPLIPGTYDVTVTASDGRGGTDVAVFVWTIVGDLYLPFDDVGAGHVFAEDITWMYAMGISLGCGGGADFCPGDVVTREQVATFLVGAFNLVDGAGTTHSTTTTPRYMKTISIELRIRGSQADVAELASVPWMNCLVRKRHPC